jgi:hypothetical protein
MAWHAAGPRSGGARTSCSRNHRRYTLCGYHHNERHPGSWTDRPRCLKESDRTERYVRCGTNEDNFERLANPPAFEPTRCHTCGRTIARGREGYATRGDESFCERCMG